MQPPSVELGAGCHLESRLAIEGVEHPWIEGDSQKSSRRFRTLFGLLPVVQRVVALVALPETPQHDVRGSRRSQGPFVGADDMNSSTRRTQALARILY